MPRVHLRLEHADEREIAIPLGVVKPVPHDELVGDLEAAIVDLEREDPAGRLVQQDAKPKRGRALPAQMLEDVRERVSGVEDVLDDDYVAALDRLRKVREDPHYAALLGRSGVRRHLSEVEGEQS